MSTRGTTFWDDPTDTTGWHVQPKPWCATCCVPSCGCPNEPTIGDNITLGSE